MLRRFQFNLRALLWLTAVFAFYAAGCPEAPVIHFDPHLSQEMKIMANSLVNRASGRRRRLLLQ